MYRPRDYYQPIVDTLGELSYRFSRFEIAGSWRRLKPEIKDIDVVCLCERPLQFEYITSWIANHGKLLYGATVRLTAQIIIDTEVFGRKIYANSLVDFRIHYEKEEWPTALAHFTGSKEHNIMMRSRAKKYGFKLNEYGLWLAGIPTHRVDIDSESDLYSTLEKEYVPPERR